MLRTACVGAVAAGVDYSLGSRSALGVVLAIGLGAGWGALIGLAAAVLSIWTSGAGGRARFAAWWLSLAGGAIWTLSSLGAFAKLGGRRADSAAAAIGGSVVLVTALAVVAAAPHERWQRWQRAGLAVCALLLAVAAAWLDRVAFPGLYPEAHASLRVAAVLAASLAWLVLAPPRRDLRALLVVPAALLAVPLVGLDTGRPRELHDLLARPFPSSALAAWRTLTDWDGDGASAWLAGGDCAAFDARVAPGREEIPGNGVDDNCSFGDAPARAAQRYVPPPASGPSPRSVVLITIDSVRPDHTTPYGYARDTTPALARFAQQSVLFERAYSPGAWTSIALAAITRGVAAPRLRWTAFVETESGRLVEPGAEGDERPVLRFGFPVDDPRPTLAELLRARGMHTVAVVDDGFSEMLSRRVGAARGFDRYVEGDETDPPNDDGATAAAAIAALDEIAPGRAFFLWVHFFGPHRPNEAPPEDRLWGDGELDGYDAELHAVDRRVGRVLAALDERGGLPVTTIVTSDHGESLYPRFRMHGFSVGEQNLRVPLLIRDEGTRARRVPGIASLLDLVPTILELTSTPVPPYLDGISLVPALGGVALPERVLLADTWMLRHDGARRLDWTAAFDGRHKLMRNLIGNSDWVVDQRDDGLWPDNLAGTVPTEALDRKIRAYLDESPGIRTLSGSGSSE